MPVPSTSSSAPPATTVITTSPLCLSRRICIDRQRTTAPCWRARRSGGIPEFRRPQEVAVLAASSDQQRARVLASVKARRSAPPPARAGRSRRATSGPMPAGSAPRARGAVVCCRVAGARRALRPPRARGGPPRTKSLRGGRGFIPACAGPIATAVSVERLSTVHPRAREEAREIRVMRRRVSRPPCVPSSMVHPRLVSPDRRRLARSG